MTKRREDSALAEGLYWMAEKSTGGYEAVEPNLVEAYKFFRQAADLGFSDALSELVNCKSMAKEPLGTLTQP